VFYDPPQLAAAAHAFSFVVNGCGFVTTSPRRLGELLHSLRQPHRMPLGCVVHAQVIADLPDYTSPELSPMRTEKLRASVRRSSSA
jgi:hypothetical protein